MIRVVNKHWHRPTANDVYIGRGSVLGNRWSHKQGTQAMFVVPTREEAIGAYRDWINDMIIDHDPDVCRVLNRIYSMARTTGYVNLVCYCSPNPCHGDVIKEIVEAKLKERLGPLFDQMVRDGDLLD